VNSGQTRSGPGSSEAPANVFEREATVAAWDDDYYHQISVRYYDRAVPDLLRLMGVNPGDPVLDAGCGPGVHSIRAARFGATVRAIDLSETMLTHARARAAEAGFADRIAFARDDLTRLSLPTGTFPFVFSWGVVILVPEFDAALEELARILARGGRLGLHVSLNTSLDFRLERTVRRLARRKGAFQETDVGTGRWYDFQNDRLWVQRFNPRRLTAAMERRGLTLLGARGAEFTEFHRRLTGRARLPLLHLNALAYRLRLPAALYCTAMLVFEKPR
jgi:ubiquinone/menaquinone biosynthesis C-methylase UbiE